MVIGATEDSVMMVEGELKEISEEEMVEAIRFAHDAIKAHCKAQVRLAEAFGKKPTREYAIAPSSEEIAAKVRELAYDKIYAIAKAGSSKHERSDAFDAIKEEVLAAFTDEEKAENESLI